MDNLNLDIDTYSLEDLSKLFNLKDEYNEIDIDNEKQTLLSQLGEMINIGVEKKRNITFFIDSAAGRLITLANDKKTDENQGTWSQLKNDTIQEGSHTIIENPNIKAGQVASFSDGRTAGSNNTPPGFLNPINVKSIARGVNIDSRFRDNYYSTHSHDYVVSLPDTYRKVTEMRIGSIELPMTMYAISKHSGNNTFVIKDTSNNNAWLLTVPDGNYEISWQDQSVAQDIITTMNQAISMAIPGTIDECGKFVIDLSKNPLDPTRDICYTIDRNTGRSIFANVVDKNQDNALKTSSDIIANINELSMNELSMNELSMNVLSMNELSNNVYLAKTNVDFNYGPSCELYETSYNNLTHNDLEKVYLATRKQTKIINNILIDYSYSEAKKLITINDIVKDVGNLNNTTNNIDTKITNASITDASITDIIDEANILQEISENIIYNYKNISNKLQKLDDSTVSLNNIKYKNTEKFCDARNNYKNAEVHRTKAISDASRNLKVVNDNSEYAILDASTNYHVANNRYMKLKEASGAVLQIVRNYDFTGTDPSLIEAHYIPNFEPSTVKLIDIDELFDYYTQKTQSVENKKLVIEKLLHNITKATNHHNDFILKNDIKNFIDDISVNDLSNPVLYKYKYYGSPFYKDTELNENTSPYNSIFRMEKLLNLVDASNISQFADFNNDDKYRDILYLECALRFVYMYFIMEYNQPNGNQLNGIIFNQLDVLQESENRKNDLLDLIRKYENDANDFDLSGGVFDLYGNPEINILVDASSNSSFTLLNVNFESSGPGYSFDISDNVYLFNLLNLVLESSGPGYSFDISENSLDITDKSFNLNGGDFKQVITDDSGVIINDITEWDTAKNNIKKCALIFLYYLNYKWKGEFINYSLELDALFSLDLPQMLVLTNILYKKIDEFSYTTKVIISKKLIFDKTFIDNSTNRIIYNEDDEWYTNLFGLEKSELFNETDKLIESDYINYTKLEIKKLPNVNYNFTLMDFNNTTITNLDINFFEELYTDLLNYDDLLENDLPNKLYDFSNIKLKYIELTNDDKNTAYFNIIVTNEIDISYDEYIFDISNNINEYKINFGLSDLLDTSINKLEAAQLANAEKSGLLKLASDAHILSSNKIDTSESRNVILSEDQITKDYIESLADKGLAEKMLSELDTDWDKLKDLWNRGVAPGVAQIRDNWNLIYKNVKENTADAKMQISKWWFGDELHMGEADDDPIFEETSKCMSKYFKIILKENVENPGKNFVILDSNDILSVELKIFDYIKYFKELQSKGYRDLKTKNAEITIDKFKGEIDHYNLLVTYFLKWLVSWSSSDKYFENIDNYFGAIIGYRGIRKSWAKVNEISWWGEAYRLENKPYDFTGAITPEDFLYILMDLKNKGKISKDSDYKVGGNIQFDYNTHRDGISYGYTYLYKIIMWDFWYFYEGLEYILYDSLNSGSINLRLTVKKDTWESENVNRKLSDISTVNILKADKFRLELKYKQCINYYEQSLTKQKNILRQSHSLFSIHDDDDIISDIDNIVYNSSDLLTSSITSLAFDIYHIETQINYYKQKINTELQIAHLFAEIAVKEIGNAIQTLETLAIVKINPIAQIIEAVTATALVPVKDILEVVEIALRISAAFTSADAVRRQAQKDVDKSGAEREMAVEGKHNANVKFLSAINDFLNHGVTSLEKVRDASDNFQNVKEIWGKKIEDSIDYYDITNKHETDVVALAKHMFCKVISENQAIELESIINIVSQFNEIAGIINKNNEQIETRKNNLDNFGKTITDLNSNMTDSFASIIPNNWELLFNVDVNGNVDLTENLQLRLGWMLGFRAGCYKPDIVEGAAVTSEGICLVSPPRYLFISINDGQKSQGTGLVAAYSQSSLDSNIMTRINCAATMDSTKVFKCASDVGLSNQLNRTRQYFGPVNISRLHIQVLDEYGRHVSLNHMDWSLTLVFDQLYD
jgi:hypothetical protein